MAFIGRKYFVVLVSISMVFFLLLSLQFLAGGVFTQLPYQMNVFSIFNLPQNHSFLKTVETSNDLPNEITIVTFYTKLEKFRKGDGNLFFEPNTYLPWMQSWNMLTNRVIGFFDDDKTLDYFRKQRSGQPSDRTFLIKINRTELSAFKRVEKVRQIFQTPNYPKYSPNTVVPEYSGVQHAKYDVIQIL